MEIVSNAMQEFKFIVWVISLNQVLELVAHVTVLLLGFLCYHHGQNEPCLFEPMTLPSSKHPSCIKSQGKITGIVNQAI